MIERHFDDEDMYGENGFTCEDYDDTDAWDDDYDDGDYDGDDYDDTDYDGDD